MKRAPLYVGVSIVSILLVLAMPVLAGPPGTWTTDFTLFNLGGGIAHINVMRYTQYAGSTDTGTLVKEDVINPNGSFYYNPATDTAFPNFSGSIVVSSDQPLAGTVTIANGSTGSSYASDAYSAVSAPATSVLLPIVMARLGVWNTRITVQNAGTGTTNVTIHYIGSGAPSNTTINNLPANMMAMVDQYSDVGGVTGFNGSALVSASQPLAVVVEEYKTTGGVLISYNGIPVADAGKTVYMPGFIAQGQWATDFTIINTEAATAAITVTFAGVGNVLHGSIGANGSAYINGFTGNYPSGWTGTAPTSAYYGAATVTSNKNVAVAYNIANSAGGPGNQQMGYVGFPATGAAQNIVVPLIENLYSTGWVTTYSVQSVDGTAAQLTLTYAGNKVPTGCNPNCTVNMTGASQTFNQQSDGHIPTGFLGGVRIAANKNIVVIADQSNFLAPGYQNGDSTAGFVGFVAP